MPSGPARCRRAPTATSPAMPRWRFGLVAASHRSGLPLVLGPSDHPGLRHPAHALVPKRHGVTTMQAEDEIAGIGNGAGREFRYGHWGHDDFWSRCRAQVRDDRAGSLLELPLVIVDVQRGGPLIGLPTKTEQADLLQAMFGRNGESPVPIVAPQTPSDRFDAAMEAADRDRPTGRPSVLSDGYPPMARSREGARGLLPPALEVEFATEPNGVDAQGEPAFHPYQRDAETLACPWRFPTAMAGAPIGGIEKADVTGNISMTRQHDRMTRRCARPRSTE